MQAFLKKHNAKKRLPVQITDINTNITKNFDSIVATAAALNTNEKNVSALWALLQNIANFY